MSEQFSPWEHLQSTISSAYNKIVREEFSDTEDDDGITTSRSSLKIACTVDDSDSAPMVSCRMMLFYFTCRKAQDLQRPVYGIPEGTFDEIRKYRPQITLHFVESYEDVDIEEGYHPVYGECSYRLMSETSESITESELNTIANRIKSEFGAGNGYIWRKGKAMLTYTDASNGFGLKIACRSESEGRAVVSKVFDVAQKTPNWKYCNYKENLEPAEAYPNNPGTDVILGQSRKTPRKRPVADVVFRYATAKIYGMPNPIVLYDKTGRYRNALVDDF